MLLLYYLWCQITHIQIYYIIYNIILNFYKKYIYKRKHCQQFPPLSVIIQQRRHQTPKILIQFTEETKSVCISYSV